MRLSLSHSGISAKVLVHSAMKLREQEDVFKTGELFPAVFQTYDPTLDPNEAKRLEVSMNDIKFDVV